MKKMIEKFQAAYSILTRKAKDQKGATMVEYALLVALIAVVCITAVTAIGSQAQDKFTAVSDAIKNTTSSGAGDSGGTGN